MITNKYKFPGAWAAGISLCAFAVAASPAAHAQRGTTQVTVDQSPVIFSGQQPVQSGGRILVPLRGVLEKLGAYVGFDSRSQTVTAFRGATRITLPIGGRQALINDRAVTLDAPARVVNGSTLVPLRFVAEALGAQVAYDVNTNTVAIASGANVASGTPAANNPPPAVVADLTSVSGTVSAIYANVSPPRLVLRVSGANGDAREQTIPLKADAKITVQRIGKADPVISLKRINVGDQVAVMENGAGQGIAVSVTARTGSPQTPNRRNNGKGATVTPVTPTSGTFKGEFLEADKKNGYYTLKMTDGRSVDIDDDASIVWENQKIGPDDLRSGDTLIVTIDPKSKRGTRVAVSDPAY